jgi:hypothetical protein
MRLISPLQPPDFVDLLLNLETLEVVEFRLVALESAVHIVFPSPRNAILALKEKISITFITVLP